MNYFYLLWGIIARWLSNIRTFYAFLTLEYVHNAHFILSIGLNIMQTMMWILVIPLSYKLERKVENVRVEHGVDLRKNVLWMKLILIGIAFMDPMHQLLHAYVADYYFCVFMNFLFAVFITNAIIISRHFDV
ncbi:hypothetical protein [Flavobacterium sp.]|uniref:hypothetical protein n=1 Tax=Flavobacterium sp. TaxID=239 RepID=UPI0039E55593